MKRLAKMSMIEMANALIDGDISSYRIAKDTGISVSSIVELRSGNRKMGNLRMGTVETLAGYYHSLNVNAKEIEISLDDDEYEKIEDGHYRLFYETDNNDVPVIAGRATSYFTIPGLEIQGAGTDYDLTVDIFDHETHGHESIGRRSFGSITAPEGIEILLVDGESAKLRGGLWIFSARADHKPGFVAEKLVDTSDLR